MAQENLNQTVDTIAEQGREIVRKANQRHVVVRRADGTRLLDVSVTILAIVAVALFFFQPLGTFVAIGAVVYGIVNKLKVEVVHELKSKNDVVEINTTVEEN